MGKPKIPDRSNEPAVQDSLDHEKSTTAANSSDVEPDAPEARDDEGNAVVVPRKVAKVSTPVKPDSDAGSQ